MYQNDSVLLSLSRFGCSFCMSDCPNRSFRSCHALVTLLYVWQQVGVWHSNRAKTSCTELFEVHFLQQDLSFTYFEFINFCFVLWNLFKLIDFFKPLGSNDVFMSAVCLFCFQDFGDTSHQWLPNRLWSVAPQEVARAPYWPGCSKSSPTVLPSVSHVRLMAL